MDSGSQEGIYDHIVKEDQRRIIKNFCHRNVFGHVIVEKIGTLWGYAKNLVHLKHYGENEFLCCA